jgi:hypothetical protein
MPMLQVGKLEKQIKCKTWGIRHPGIHQLMEALVDILPPVTPLQPHQVTRRHHKELLLAIPLKHMELQLDTRQHNGLPLHILHHMAVLAMQLVRPQAIHLLKHMLVARQAILLQAATPHLATLPHNRPMVLRILLRVTPQHLDMDRTQPQEVILRCHLLSMGFLLECSNLGNFM